MRCHWNRQDALHAGDLFSVCSTRPLLPSATSTEKYVGGQPLTLIFEQFAHIGLPTNGAPDAIPPLGESAPSRQANPILVCSTQSTAPVRVIRNTRPLAGRAPSHSSS